jgi:hypothetical protein
LKELEVHQVRLGADFLEDWLKGFEKCWHVFFFDVYGYMQAEAVDLWEWEGHVDSAVIFRLFEEIWIGIYTENEPYFKQADIK